MSDPGYKVKPTPTHPSRRASCTQAVVAWVGAVPGGRLLASYSSRCAQLHLLKRIRTLSTYWLPLVCQTFGELLATSPAFDPLVKDMGHKRFQKNSTRGNSLEQKMQRDCYE